MLVSYKPRPHGLLKEGGTRKFSNIMLPSFDKDYLINFFSCRFEIPCRNML